MDSKTILGLVILFFSRTIILGSSQNLDSLIAGATSDLPNQGVKDGTNPATKCVSKLLPCQPYLHSSTPPAVCCGPLKEMVAKEPDCLCSFLSNTAMLNSFNVTKDGAVNLAKSCGANPDLSLCKDSASSPTSSPSTPSTPHTNSTTGFSPSSASNSTNATIPSDSDDHKKSNAGGVLPSMSLGLAVTYVVLLLLSSLF